MGQARTTIPGGAKPRITAQTHMVVKFGSWSSYYLMPIEAAAQLLPLMRDSYAFETERINEVDIYTPKQDRNINTEWMATNAFVLPVDVTKRDAAEYMTALKTTAQLQGEQFDPRTMPFEEWFKERNTPAT